MQDVKTDVPMVIRLVGTNAEDGRQILADADMAPAETLAEAAQKAVALAKGSASLVTAKETIP
jgi:succinyl-CoA synthetase beta subunit